MHNSEIIKNKTLTFLARSLPILKAEVDVIPKVARYGRNPAHAGREVGGLDIHQTNPFFHYLIREKRSTPQSASTGSSPTIVKSNHSPSSSSSSSSSGESNSERSSQSGGQSSAAATTNYTQTLLNSAATLKKAERKINETLGRACEGNNGMWVLSSSQSWYLFLSVFFIHYINSDVIVCKVYRYPTEYGVWESMRELNVALHECMIETF